LVLFFIKENIIFRAHVATGKKKEEVDNKSLFQQNNLKHQRDIDEHKLKVCIRYVGFKLTINISKKYGDLGF